MKQMTYKQFAEYIMGLTEQQQNQTVTLFNPRADEYYAACVSYTDESCDVLDPNHLVLTPM